MEKYKLIILKAYVSVCQRINTLRWSSVKNKHCKKRVEEVGMLANKERYGYP